VLGCVSASNSGALTKYQVAQRDGPELRPQVHAYDWIRPGEEAHAVDIFAGELGGAIVQIAAHDLQQRVFHDLRLDRWDGEQLRSACGRHFEAGQA
jgi:hypothetical protein